MAGDSAFSGDSQVARTPPGPKSQPGSRFPVRLSVGCILGLHVALLAWTAYRNSPVRGEVAHLSAGVSHCVLGNFDLYRVNPPFIRTIAALPVLAAHPKTDWRRFGSSRLNRYEYDIAVDFVRANGPRTFWLVTLGRWMAISFSTLTCYFCFLWAKSLYGTSAGILAMLLWSFCPFSLGLGSVLVPDSHVAALSLMTVYAFSCWLDHPTWLLALAFGTSLGIAILCKFTALILWPWLPFLWVVNRIVRPATPGRREWLRQTCMLTSALAISVFVINCGYLFEGTFSAFKTLRFQSGLFTGVSSLQQCPPDGANRFSGTWLGELPVALPTNMLQGIDAQRLDFERGSPSYLHGQWSSRGWWYYYLYAFAVKLPLGTWCLIIAAVFMTFLGRSSPTTFRGEGIVLATFFLVLVFVSSQTGFSAHSRYSLPALPFLYVWTSRVAVVFVPDRRRLSTLVIAGLATSALVWSVGSSLYVYPHSLSYFNEFAGGPHQGPKHLLDSNVDWGQDLLYLDRWLKRHPDHRLDGLAYHAWFRPDYIGFRKTKKPPNDAHPPEQKYDGLDCGPLPGLYAVSVNLLYDPARNYTYFGQFSPIAKAGYSIYIFDISFEEANNARRKLRLPLLPANWMREQKKPP